MTNSQVVLNLRKTGQGPFSPGRFLLKTQIQPDQVECTNRLYTFYELDGLMMALTNFLA